MQHLTEVVMYNDSGEIIADSGLVSRTKGIEVSLDILLMFVGDMFFYDEDGRFTKHGIKFQISAKELDDNSFTIESGKTFLVFNSDTYRVISVNDRSLLYNTQLVQCKAVKIIDAD